MISVTLYWNNICILHRQELVFLERIRQSLASRGIDLTITCFGLGYGRHMSEYLRSPDAPLPDLVVSTDLEVFEDSRIFRRLEASGLYPLNSLLPAAKDRLLRPLFRQDELLPYLAIPLVFFGRKDFLAAAAVSSLDRLVETRTRLALGGIRNSALKTVAKALWESGGPGFVREFLSCCHAAEMPVQAFHLVQTDVLPLSLVPSVYALRADGEHRAALWPDDGAIAVPSYICARTSIPKDAALTVIEALRSPEIFRFYRESGQLICCDPSSRQQPALLPENGFLRLPSRDFLKSLPPEDFDALYQEFFPLTAS